MLFPYRCKNPPESFPFATVVLIAANVLVFAATSSHFEIRQDIVNQFAESPSHFTLTRAFACLFLHNDPLHLGFNMWFLYLFGVAVEGRLKSLKFLLVYFVAGALGGLLQVWTLSDISPDVFGFGASGAIMGVMGAALYMFPFAKVKAVYFIGWPLEFAWIAAGDACLNLFWIGLYFFSLDALYAALGSPDGIGHFAHMGGVIGGLIACAWCFPVRDSRQVSEAKAEMADHRDYGLLSAAELQDIASVNPADTTLILNWTVKCLETGRLSDECRRWFRNMFPKILAEEPATAVGSALLGMVWAGESPDAEWLVDAGIRVESAGEPSLALKLFDAALSSNYISFPLREQALYRAGLLCQSKIGKPLEAENRYRELIRLLPMSPLASQARIRLLEMMVPSGGYP